MKFIGFITAIWLLIGCGLSSQRINLQKTKDEINNYLDSTKLQFKLDTLLSPQKEKLDLIFINKSNDPTFFDDYEMQIYFSEFLYYRFFKQNYFKDIKQITFIFKKDGRQFRDVRFLGDYFGKIETKYANKCYLNTISFVFSSINPEMIYELQKRFTNLQIYLRLRPDANFYDNLVKIAEHKCKESGDIYNLSIFRLVLTNNFYSHYGDSAMVNIVHEIFKKNNIDLNGIDLSYYDYRMGMQIDSLGLIDDFLNDTNLVRKREELINSSKTLEYHTH
jgi:hypothetical protein